MLLFKLFESVPDELVLNRYFFSYWFWSVWIPSDDAFLSFFSVSHSHVILGIGVFSLCMLSHVSDLKMLPLHALCWLLQFVLLALHLLTWLLASW